MLETSALFSIDKVNKNGSYVRIVLNILPMTINRTAIIFSYSKEDSAEARRFLKNILGSRGDEQKLAVSCLIIKHIENFFIAPTHFSIWSEDKKAAIRKAFVDTLYDFKLELKKHSLYQLF
jgi:hypothetical protein